MCARSQFMLLSNANISNTIHSGGMRALGLYFLCCSVLLLLLPFSFLPFGSIVLNFYFLSLYLLTLCSISLVAVIAPLYVLEILPSCTGPSFSVCLLPFPWGE